MMLSYPLWVRVRGQRSGLVWQTDDGTAEVEGDTDCVLVKDGRIVSARTPEELATLASEYGLELEEGTDEPQDLDGLERLLELPASDEICAKLIDAWNLFNDIARSVGASLDDSGPEASRCYDKLFYGTNLESITPVGEHYSPEFTDEERFLVAEVFNRGRTILTARSQSPGAEEQGPR